MPVNREALLEKLAKMGVSPRAVYPLNHVVVAVEEFVASEGTDPEVVVCECGLGDAVAVASNGPALSPGSLVLTADEVAYMVLEFAGCKV